MRAEMATTVMSGNDRLRNGKLHLRTIFNFKRRKHPEVFLKCLPDSWKVGILRVSLIFEVCCFNKYSQRKITLTFKTEQLGDIFCIVYFGYLICIIKRARISRDAR